MHTRRTLWAPLACVLLLAGTLAGCLGGDGGDSDPAEIPFEPRWARAAVPWGDGHDHYDPSHHKGLSTPNFEVLGYEPLISSHYGHTASGHLCGDATSVDGRELAVVHSFSSEVAFTLLDVTDPYAPTILGEFVLPHTGSRDVALTPDGGFVAIAVSAPQTGDAPVVAGMGAERLLGTLSGAAVPAPYFRDACTGVEHPIAQSGLGPEQDLPFPPGVMLVDVRDPANMAIVDFYPQPLLGGHSVTTGSAGGITYVISSVTNLATAASYFWFLEVTDTPLGMRMLPRSVYHDSPAEANAPLINGHNDGWVQDHPVTGQPLAYLANWNQGVVILDLSDPVMPTVIGRWHDNPAGVNAEIQTDGVGSVHQAFPMADTLDGRHYTFIGQEIITRPSATPSGWVRVLDTTDPTNPHVVAEWTLPVEVEWSQQLLWSTHYVDYHGTTLFVAHYHAGVWAIDLSGLPNDPYPPAIGVFVPDHESPHPPPRTSYDWSPTIMEANVLGTGDLIVWDSASGAYVVRFHADQPMPPAIWTEYLEHH